VPVSVCWCALKGAGAADDSQQQFLPLHTNAGLNQPHEAGKIHPSADLKVSGSKPCSPIHKNGLFLAEDAFICRTTEAI